MAIELLIKDAKEAGKFIARKRTAAFRIWNVDPKRNTDYLSVVRGAEKTFDYRFDDIKPGEVTTKDDVIFDETIARKAIEDFRSILPWAECALIHCTGGKSRSPAFAIAYNEIFNLGHWTLLMIMQHTQYNRLVYRTMIKTAREMGFDLSSK